jgi:hypothetical protein
VSPIKKFNTPFLSPPSCFIRLGVDFRTERFLCLVEFLLRGGVKRFLCLVEFLLRGVKRFILFLIIIEKSFFFFQFVCFVNKKFIQIFSLVTSSSFTAVKVIPILIVMQVPSGVV